MILAVVVADLGTAVVLGVAAAVVFFVAGLEWRYCAIAAVVALVGVVLFICREAVPAGARGAVLRSAVQDHRQVRPAGHDQDADGEIAGDARHQLSVASNRKIAVGAGGPIGLGLDERAAEAAVPSGSAHGFHLRGGGRGAGLFGTVGLLVGFGVIFWRGLRAAVRMHDDFGRYLALGVTVVVVVQGLMNMSVVLGMMPTKGIPLPMISYGGSSLLSTLALLGILMNVSEHAG